MSEFRQIAVGVVLLIFVVGILAYGTYTWISKNGVDDTQNVASLFTSENEATFTDIDGNEVEMKVDAPGIRIVNVWASWSPYSVSELPLLHEAVATYGNDTVTVIAVNRSEPKYRAQAFLSRLGDVSNLDIIIDENDQVYKQMEGYSMPETRFYDASGNLVHHHRGALSKEDVDRYLSDMLSDE